MCRGATLIIFRGVEVGWGAAKREISKSAIIEAEEDEEADDEVLAQVAVLEEEEEEDCEVKGERTKLALGDVNPFEVLPGVKNYDFICEKQLKKNDFMAISIY